MSCSVWFTPECFLLLAHSKSGPRKGLSPIAHHHSHDIIQITSPYAIYRNMSVRYISNPAYITSLWLASQHVTLCHMHAKRFLPMRQTTFKLPYCIPRPVASNYKRLKKQYGQKNQESTVHLPSLLYQSLRKMSHWCLVRTSCVSLISIYGFSSEGCRVPGDLITYEYKVHGLDTATDSMYATGDRSTMHARLS